jgi:hypothetical protein
MRILPGAGLDARQRRVLLWAACALFLAEWADVSVKNVSETLFLKRIGVEFLPLAFLVNGLLLLATTSLLGNFAARMDPSRLFTRALAGLGLVLLLLWLLVHFGRDASFPLLLLASKQISAISLLSFSSATGALIEPRQQKALLPPLLAVGTLGSILGSFASGPLGRWLDVEALLPISVLLLFLGAAATLPLRPLRAPRVVLARRPLGSAAHPAPPTPQASARRLWEESWLFRALTLSALLCGAVGPMLYFQFAYVADMATRGQGGEEKLLSLFGQVRGSLLLGVMAAQLWLAPALYRRVGVPLAGTLSPLFYLLGFGGLTFRLGLPEGVAALSGATVQDQAVHDPSQRLLCALFPEEIRPRVLALVEGTAKRAGGVLGNLLVIATVAFGSAYWVGVIGLPVTLLWLFVTLRIRRGYPSLVLSLATEPHRLSHAGAPMHELIDARMLRSLAGSLESGRNENCRTAIDLLRELRPDVAPVLLAAALPRAQTASRPLLLSSLEALLEDVQAKPGAYRAAVHALEVLLRDHAPAEGRQRAALVRIYARLQDAMAPEPAAAALLRSAVHDPSPVVRVAAETALYRLGLRRGSPLALRRVLGPALGSTDPNVRQVAGLELRALLIEDPRGDAADVGPGRPEWQARLALLIHALSQPAARALAAGALADVAARHGTLTAVAAVPLRALADDRDPGVRKAVLRYAGHAQRTELAPLLVERLVADAPEEAAAARDALGALGPRALDALLPELAFGHRKVRDAIVPLLHALEASPKTFEVQLRRELEGVANRLLEIAGLHGRAPELLLQRLEERVHEGLHSVFLLLATLHGDDRLLELADSLGRNQTPRDRALRVEALEALLAPEERETIIPFVEDPHLDLRVIAAIGLLGRRPLSRDATLEALREDHDPLTRKLLPDSPSEAATAVSTGSQGEGMPALGEVEILMQLRSVDIFEHLSVRQLAGVAQLVKQQLFPAGVAIVREGERTQSMYAITDGGVVVTRHGVHLSELRTGDIFGELALFDGESRSATVTTCERVRVLRIEGRDLMALMEELPGIAIAICRTLSQLVRQTTDRSLLAERAAV